MIPSPSSENPIIRPATPDDAAALLDIYAWYVRNTAISFEWEVPTTEVFRARIEATLRRYPWLVLERDGRILGYAYAGAFKGRTSYDWSAEVSIYLAPDARGQGHGRRLYEALEAELATMGIRNLYACIACPEREDEYLTRNSPDFHAHLGYRLVGTFRRCASKFGRWYDMVWMEKHIAEHGDNPEPVKWKQSL